MGFDKILMIDDETFINAIQTASVKEYFPDTEMMKFDFPEEAIRIIKEKNENNEKLLIFLDLNMPVMSALDVLDEIDKINFNQPPVIFILTFSKDPTERAAAAKHPYVKALLMKPINKEKVKGILDLLEM
ncbi:response regulator [Autumnicola psychrophila]|uniref:Response regulator n=1 Tax=Autumnicola psychrophila TaxID=3075592 RepID=A0ABU3DN26_9FLAO|nr:response regulator [Zunongwangia sp. F225]MDT0684929.1 response regulator [Zunongwangia sp. F225]